MAEILTSRDCYCWDCDKTFKMFEVEKIYKPVNDDVVEVGVCPYCQSENWDEVF